MLNAKGLKKTYYKGKSNEIKVINDTTLELPEKGLVSFLGPSGSGKTTLLNVLGGLDSIDSGSIDYDTVEITKNTLSRLDDFRRENIGYIFQNYLILEKLTVYENLRLALEIIHITDPDEVKKRIEYSLKAVGLYKYRKKIAGDLSGGQKQRISIARCLVKKSKIIIADEPTGNLDSENTIEIMNILQLLSKESLVLLVTHSRDIARYYSNYIVELKDGQVLSFNENVSSGSLENLDDRSIHLMDYDYQSTAMDGLDISYYRDKESKDISLRIIVKNNTVYIDGDEHIQVLDSASISVQNDHMEKVPTKNVDFEFDNSWFNEKKTALGFRGFFKKIWNSLYEFFTEPNKNKVFNLVFLLLGMMLAVMMILYTSYTYVDKKKISREPGIYKIFEESAGTTEYEYVWDKSVLINAVEEGCISDYYISEQLFSLTFSLNAFKDPITYSWKSFIFDSDKIKGDGLICGEFPKSTKEIVLGKGLADNILAELGREYSYKDLLGAAIDNYSVSGVSTVDSTSIYSYSAAYAMKAQYYKGESTIDVEHVNRVKVFYEEGRAPEALDEISISRNFYKENPLDIGTKISFEGKEYTITGIFNEYRLTSDSCVMLTLDYDLLQAWYDYATYQFKKRDNMDIFNEKYKYFASASTNSFSYTILEGREPENENEVMLPVYEAIPIGTKIGSFEVVGKYYTDEVKVSISGQSYFTYLIMIKDKKTMMKDCINSFANEYVIYKIDDIERANTYFKAIGYKLISFSDHELTLAKKEAKEGKYLYPLLLVSLFVVALVYTYFSQRARMIADVYTIGVLRSLGTRRSTLVLRSLRDNFIKITFTTLLGYLVVMIGYACFATKVNELSLRTLLPVEVLPAVIGISIVYISQLIIGILPLAILLRKTPAELNSKYDL